MWLMVASRGGHSAPRNLEHRKLGGECPFFREAHTADANNQTNERTKFLFKSVVVFTGLSYIIFCAMSLEGMNGNDWRWPLKTEVYIRVSCLHKQANDD